MKIFYLSFILVLFSFMSRAQYIRGDQQISFGYGSPTSEQMFDGTLIEFLEPTIRLYSNTEATGAIFLNYHYFVGNRVSLGLYGGFEQESGDWFAVQDMSRHRNDWTTDKIGTFSRQAYTLAPELSVYYGSGKEVSAYTTVGIGGTFKYETDVDAIAGKTTQNDATKFNAYYSPLGIRFNLAGNLSGFLEVGIGYKGIVNGGLSWHFKTGKLKPKPDVKVAAPAALRYPVIIVPRDYPIDSSFKYLGRVTTGNAKFQRKATFNKQVNKVAAGTIDRGGNVLQVTLLEDHHLRNRYTIRGDVYHYNAYDSLKTKLATESTKAAGTDSSLVVLYLPANVKHKARLRVGDSAEFVLNPNTSRQYHIKSGQPFQVSTRSTGSLNIDPRPGGTYYIRASFVGSKATLRLMDPLEGELQSGFIKNKLSTN